MKPLYVTDRLAVRPWTDEPADVDRVFAIYSQWDVARWLGAQPRAMADRAEAAAVAKRWAEFTARDDRYGCWAIEVRDGGVAAGSAPGEDRSSRGPQPRVVGSVLFTPLPGGDGEVEVGWHLHPDSWGHGYATEAARGAVERGFASGLTEVYAVVRPDNEPSMAVCRRLGMTPLGRTTRWYGVEVEAFRLTAG
ncbi:GNAT family N-acetyltransferase [Planosporangium sp. 12N6]|uniref:GNAT family N-acetyltransferase n=1 Tax=Planosporangium spinosum TaxID=3402278 RepID=UPI003CF5F07B